MQKEIVLKQFGERLKELRLKKGISQEVLADRCGLDRTYISGLERGLRNPSLICVFRVSRGLGVNIEVLIEKYNL